MTVSRGRLRGMEILLILILFLFFGMPVIVAVGISLMGRVERTLNRRAEKRTPADASTVIEFPRR